MGDTVKKRQTHEFLRQIPHICAGMLVVAMAAHMSEAWPSSSERRFYDGDDRKVDGSTPTQASLLRPWIRCFTTIIFA